MKILVVDDHHLIREALRGVLKEVRRDAVVLEAPTAAQARQIIVRHADIGLVLLDLALPDHDGFLLLEELRREHPAMSVAVLSAAQTRPNVIKALNLGASGYIPKSASRDVMLSAIQLILAGGEYIPPQALERDSGAEAAGMLVTREEIEDCAARVGLRGRQIDILELLMQGKSNKVICRALGLSEPTVKNHVTAILRALRVNSRTEVVIAVSHLARHPATPDTPARSR